MKKFYSDFIKILVYLLLVVISSCSKNLTLEDECEIYFKNQLNDLKSFEKISVKIIDTIKTSDKLTEKLQTLNDNISFQLILNDTLKIKQLSDERDSISKELYNLKNNSTKNTIQVISLLILYRAKNEFGALTKGKSIVHYLPNDTSDNSKKFFIFSSE